MRSDKTVFTCSDETWSTQLEQNAFFPSGKQWPILAPDGWVYSGWKLKNICPSTGETAMFPGGIDSFNTVWRSAFGCSGVCVKRDCWNESPETPKKYSNRRITARIKHNSKMNARLKHKHAQPYQPCFGFVWARSGKFADGSPNGRLLSRLSSPPCPRRRRPFSAMFATARPSLCSVQDWIIYM